MNVRVYQPVDPKLKGIVQSYYVLSQEEDEETSYLTFPKPFGILTITKDASFKHGENSISIIKQKGSPVVSDLVLAYKGPLVVRYSGGTRELTIYFKPLGIYSFIQNKSFYPPNKSRFVPYEDYIDCMNAFFDFEDEKLAIRFIENYLVSKLIDFSHPFLFDFLEELSNDLNVSIADFCERKGVDHKTLIRHSKKYLRRTPTEFRKVLRFNRVLKDYLDYDIEQSVTNLKSFIHFFDQAHMIKDFKALTGLTPKQFFEKLNSPNQELNWILSNVR